MQDTLGNGYDPTPLAIMCSQDPAATLENNPEVKTDPNFRLVKHYEYYAQCSVIPNVSLADYAQKDSGTILGVSALPWAAVLACQGWIISLSSGIGKTTEPTTRVCGLSILESCR